MGHLEYKLQLKISDFKPFFYQGKVTNLVRWNNGSVIEYSLDHRNGNFIHLSYKINNRPFNYTVEFVSKPSNLGKGKLNYFLMFGIGKDGKESLHGIRNVCS
jgi:hypothetical protein